MPWDGELPDEPLLDAHKTRLREHFSAPGDRATYYPSVSKPTGYLLELEAIALRACVSVATPQP